MCITMRVAWPTVDRLRSNRDIRLSTATMRALNSRRPRSTSVHRLVSGSTLGLFLLLCVLRDARARSVPHDEDGGLVAVGQVHGEISGPAEVRDGVSDGADEATADADRETRQRSLTGEEEEEEEEKAAAAYEHENDDDDEDERRKKPEEEILVEDPGRIQIEAAGDEGSVAKKRRRNDVTLPGKSVLQDGVGVAPGVEESVQKDEGIRRFDAQVESDGAEEPNQRRKISEDIAGEITDSRGDAGAEQRRLIAQAIEHANAKNVDAKISDEDGAGPEGDKHEETSRSDLREKPEKSVANSEGTKKTDANRDETERVKSLAEVNLDEVRIEKTDSVNEEVRNDLRSLELNDASESERKQEERVAANEEAIDVEDLDPNREHRHLAGASGKSKYKSSTVYLNAEEGNSPGRDQESIVDGQIKKLISIRDDALGSLGDDAKRSDQLDGEGLLSGESVGIEVVAAENDEEIRNQRSSDRADTSTHGERLEQPSPTTTTDPNLFQNWRDQVALIQEQIKNRTFLQHLREQAIEVLPDIPKFTENQLLETLKNIALSRRSPSNETYSAALNATALSKSQLEIVKCAEQLVETKQRQTFIANMAECIRGLSVINCMRIFVWPIVLDNVPESVKQGLSNFPIEINLIDLFQGVRAKAARSESNARPRLLTPESVVFNILRVALDSKANYDQTPIFIDARNETLRRLLTYGQLQILQMAEMLLPGEIRREYSDRMFSCVRRFEYFSCIKYFAWPMVKQYHPALPDFPDYQTWYPSIPFYPQYPIVPFPNFVGTTGELPEVLDADATRMRKPKPEAVIVNILQNTLKEHAKVPPPSVAHSADSYIAVLPPEQLLSIHMAEQLLPTPYRSEFVQKTVKCIQEFNYITCIKYSTWPTVKQYYPSLPDISSLLPDLSFPNVFGYLPDVPSFPSLASFIPFLGGGGDSSGNGQPPQSGGSTSQQPNSRLPTILLHRSEISSKVSNELENKITEILTRVRNSLKTVPENSPQIISGNVIVLTTINEKQVNILKLAESILPPPARAPLVTQVLSCLQTNNDFINCTRYVIWPAVSLYAPNLPEFPNLPSNQQSLKQEERQTPLKDKNASHQTAKEQQEWEKSQNSNVKIISRTKFPQNSSPVISVTGTRFVPIFSEHPESVILNILRSIQLSSPNVPGEKITTVSSAQQFADLLNDQQVNILKMTESLLPHAARPSFVNRMIECVRKDNFLVCSRDVLWPTLSEHFPRLPSFPNFGGHPQAINIKPTLPQNLTDTSPFSETDVKIGQHGDATVMITDTRFYPVFTEHPEGVILNILRAVQHATPGVLNPIITSRLPEIMTYFTEQQGNIIQVAESLLPESVRPVFVERMVTCVRESTFLECTRDIAWPTIAQFFPRLPNFPNFGSHQSLPRMKVGLSSILLRNAYSENQTFNGKDQNTPKTAVDIIEDKIESILKEQLSKDSSPRLENSYLDVNNPVIGSLLTAREMNIVRLTERAIPDPLRRTYVSNMLECVRNNNFMTCTQHISWPTLRQFIPNVPNLDQLLGQLPGQIPGLPGQIPGLPDQITGLPGQIPGLPGQIPGLPGQIPGLPGQIPSLPGQIPGLDQIPNFTGQIPSLPAFGNYPFSETPGISQFPSQITTIPVGIQDGISQIPGFSGFPSFGGISFPQFGILSDAPQEPKPQGQTVQSIVPQTDQTKQISGVSVAANTPSVDDQTAIPGYLGQPTDILIDISKEKVHLFDIKQQSSPSPESVSSDPSSKKRERRRRSAEQLLNSYYEADEEVERTSQTMDNTFPNITESEFLQLLINISKSRKTFTEEKSAENTTEYFVDTLNSTVKNSLTADQYEILKIVENLNEHANRGLLSQIIQCLSSLSFIRCIGIFVWPMVTSTVPSLIGLPTLPSLPGLGILGRSTEVEVENFFGMSTADFERELLTRKESVENIFLDWYKKLMEDKFQTNFLGFLKIKGYGNGEVGISFNGFRKGRATKIKDNKNLPSILTIISDIMEEVLDQRPDNEKIKKDKEKRERSLDDMQEVDFQFLKESDEYDDIKRSINDDQIITMFLDKIKANATDFADGDVTQFLNAENAYNAFGVLFGTRLNDKFASRLKAFTEEHLRSLNKDRSKDHAKETSAEELKVIPLKGEMTYDLEKESVENQEARKREHRTKNVFRSLLNKYSDALVRSVPAESVDNLVGENNIKDTESPAEKDARSELRIQLPHLRENVVSRKITSTVIHVGRALRAKISQMMPGIGFVVSFLIQTALAHARAAASMAGMISNMALASAVFGMLRQSLFGSENQPQVKYVYDNYKTGPGITWPQHHGSHHRGK